MPEPKTHQPGVYSPGGIFWVKPSIDGPDWMKATVKSKLDGLEPFDFATSFVVLADIKASDGGENYVNDTNHQVVLKIFDHTASSKLRCRFTNEEYDSAQHEILRSASKDGSLAQLWDEFQRVVPLDVSSGLQQVAIDLRISPDTTYGKLVCRYVIGMVQTKLHDELRCCNVLPELTHDFRLKAYFLWMRQLFLHENAIGRILNQGPGLSHRKMPSMILGTRIATSPTQNSHNILSLDEHPVIVQEYIVGQPLSKVEKALLDDSNAAQPGARSTSIQRNLSVCKKLIPRSRNEMAYLLTSIFSILNSFLDEGLVFEDFRSDQAIVQRGHDGNLRCRFVGYGFLRPFRKISIHPDSDIVEPNRRFHLNDATGLLSSSKAMSGCPEEDLRFYLPKCHAIWPECFRDIRVDTGLRFQVLPTTTSTLRWRALLEDIRRTLTRIGASDLMIAWAAESVKKVTASLTYSVGDGRVLIFWLLRLFASSPDTEVKHLVQTCVQSLESHVSTLLKISESMDRSWRTNNSSFAGSSSADTRGDMVSGGDHAHSVHPANLSLPSDYIPPILTLTYRSPVTLIPQPIWNDMDLRVPSTEVEEVMRQRLEQRVQHLKQEYLVSSGS